MNYLKFPPLNTNIISPSQSSSPQQSLQSSSAPVFGSVQYFPSGTNFPHRLNLPEPLPLDTQEKEYSEAAAIHSLANFKNKRIREENSNENSQLEKTDSANLQKTTKKPRIPKSQSQPNASLREAPLNEPPQNQKIAIPRNPKPFLIEQNVRQDTNRRKKIQSKPEDINWHCEICHVPASETRQKRPNKEGKKNALCNMCGLRAIKEKETLRKELQQKPPIQCSGCKTITKEWWVKQANQKLCEKCNLLWDSRTKAVQFVYRAPVVKPKASPLPLSITSPSPTSTFIDLTNPEGE